MIEFKEFSLFFITGYFVGFRDIEGQLYQTGDITSLGEITKKSAKSISEFFGDVLESTQGFEQPNLAGDAENEPEWHKI